MIDIIVLAQNSPWTIQTYIDWRGCRMPLVCFHTSHPVNIPVTKHIVSHFIHMLEARLIRHIPKPRVNPKK